MFWQLGYLNSFRQGKDRLFKFDRNAPLPEDSQNLYWSLSPEKLLGSGVGSEDCGHADAWVGPDDTEERDPHLPDHRQHTMKRLKSPANFDQIMALLREVS